jgi:hypothetical protein
LCIDMHLEHDAILISFESDADRIEACTHVRIVFVPREYTHVVRSQVAHGLRSMCCNRGPETNSSSIGDKHH